MITRDYTQGKSICILCLRRCFRSLEFCAAWDVKRCCLARLICLPGLGQGGPVTKYVPRQVQATCVLETYLHCKLLPAPASSC